jgi:hypothetical protein
MTDELIPRLDKLLADLKASKAINVNSPALKQSVIDLARFFFQDCRQSFVSLVSPDEIGKIDNYWQALVRLAHGRNLRQSYLKLASVLKREMTEMNIRGISASRRREQTVSKFSQSEVLLIKTLGALVPSASQSYVQGILDLASVERSSYRGTASEFREALRETVDHLAPDDSVMQADGFALEVGRTQPTMRQKVKFILKSRGMNETQRTVAEKSLELIEALCGEIARAIYNRASLATHLETTRGEVLQLKRYVDTLLYDLLAITGQSPTHIQQ